jgi:hypothetical protein
LVVLALALAPDAAFAHVLKSDGSIGAVMHVKPDDDPIVGQPAEFYFEFKDKLGKFKPELCDCNFLVLQGGRTVFERKLFQSNTASGLDSALLSYTFPQKGVYHIRVAGQPVRSGSFQPFELEYNLRVSRVDGGINGGSASDWRQIALFGLAGGVFLVLFVRDRLTARLRPRHNTK